MPLARPVGGVGDPTGPEQWFYSLPLITRYWFAFTIGLTCTANFGIINPYYLVFSWQNIQSKFEIWRVATCFCYAGGFSFQMLIAVFMLIQFSKQYETGGPFNTGAGGGTADYATALIFAAILMLLTYPIAVGVIGLMMPPVFCRNLTFFVLYVWSKRFPTAQANIWGIPMAAMYLPFAYLALSILMGTPSMDMLHGLVIGHFYYFLVDVYPAVYGKDLLKTPQFLIDQFGVGMNPGAPPAAAPPAAATGGGSGGTGWNARAPPNQAGAATGGSGGSSHNWGESGQRLGRE